MLDRTQPPSITVAALGVVLARITTCFLLVNIALMFAYTTVPMTLIYVYCKMSAILLILSAFTAALALTMGLLTGTAGKTLEALLQ